MAMGKWRKCRQEEAVFGPRSLQGSTLERYAIQEERNEHNAVFGHASEAKFSAGLQTDYR
jgi:hypothetical protein